MRSEAFERTKLTWVAATSRASTSADLIPDSRGAREQVRLAVLRPSVQREWLQLQLVSFCEILCALKKNHVRLI
jgi:hypothetical protein